MPVVRRLTPVAALAACALAAGCTSKAPAPAAASSATPPPLTASATPSPTPTPTPSASAPSATPTPTSTPTASITPTATATATPLSPAAALAALAAKAPARLSVTYRLTSDSSATATVRIDAVPEGYRVSVTRAGKTASLIVRRDGDSTSCSGGKCFTVATGGDGVPSAFDPQVQHAITDDLPVFADMPDELTVTSSSLKAAGTCFAVKPSGTGPTTVVAGTYCLDESGRVTAVDYPSGLLTLVSVNPDPTAAVLKPPANPTPIASPTTHEPTD